MAKKENKKEKEIIFVSEFMQSSEVENLLNEYYEKGYELTGDGNFRNADTDRIWVNLVFRKIKKTKSFL